MRKNWTEEEINILKENIGKVKISTIAKNIGRSYESVELKMKQLKIRNTKSQTGLVTMNELANIIKVDRKIVEGWASNHGLTFKKLVTKEKRSFYFINPDDFWNWAEQHKDKVQFTNIEKQALPPEPDWVDKERRKEIEQSLHKRRKYQLWTTLEDNKLVELRESGLTYKKIGEIMNRSAVSIERRYKRIKSNHTNHYFSPK